MIKRLRLGLIGLALLCAGLPALASSFFVPPINIVRASGGGPVETLVNRTTGTNIGNMTGGGAVGLAGAFDGVTNQAAAGGAGISAAPGYVGKAHAVGKKLSRVICYGTNNVGYVNTGTTTSVTITLYAKNGTPASGTDGTSLGSITFNQNAVDEHVGRQINSSDTTTAYTNYWVYINGGAVSTYIAEVEVYEMI